MKGLWKGLWYRVQGVGFRGCRVWGSELWIICLAWGSEGFRGGWCGIEVFRVHGVGGLLS